MICKICNKELASIRELSKHVKKYHDIIYKEYYDMHIKTDDDGKCIECGKSTKFDKGKYRKFCSSKCANLNPEIRKKLIESNIKKYGVDNPSKSLEIKKKKEETFLQKYGTRHITQSDHFKDKSKITWVKKYGVDNPSKSIKIKEKKKQVKLEKYGDANYNNPLKNKETCINKYNVENIFQLSNIKEKSKNTCLQKYGVDSFTKTKKYKIICKNKYNETREKVYQTKKKNNSFHISKPENDIYYILKEKYTDIKRQYKSNVYPYSCDFYIPSNDLYIEYNNHWTHGKEPFDKNNPIHIKTLEEWKEKSNTSNFYKQAIYIWTKLDVKKRNIAKDNNLNFLEIFNIEQFNSLFINKLSYSFTEEELNKEFELLNSIIPSYNKNPHNNKIILSYQEEFYKKENKLWEDINIKIKLLNNRKKYLNKSIFSDKEILRGFKISGIHIGYSHFSPFWIKKFIEEYNITSIYDFCGGWGHRLLGCLNIDYIYNDIDYNKYNNVKRIFKDFNFPNKNKLFYNEDSSKFVPKNTYDCVFTCPPYYKTELYEINSCEQQYNYRDWLHIWWNNSIKNSLKNCKKYFCFVINEKYKKDMVDVCLENNLKLIKEEKLGKNNYNHFQRTSNNIKKSEYLIIFKVN